MFNRRLLFNGAGGVTLPDYYIVTNGVKEQVAKIHF